MLQRGNQNPYLRGKPAKKNIQFVLSEMDNPLATLNAQEKKAILESVGSTAQQEFSSNLARLKLLAQTYNPFQILAHFAYYDQILLDGADNSAGYVPVPQNALELLQALVLQIPESQLSEVLDRPPFGEPVLEINSCLHIIQSSYGVLRLGRTSSDKAAALAAEMIRQHTAFVRNEGFPSQIKRLHCEIFKTLDATFSSREGYCLSDLAKALWNLNELITQRLSADFAIRKRILGQPTIKRMLAELGRILGEKPEAIRESMSDFSNDRQAIRTAIISWWDSRNFRLFYFDEAEFQALFPSTVAPSRIAEILSSLSIGWGDLKDENPEHFILNNPVWTRPFIAVGNSNFFYPCVGLTQSFGLAMIEQALEKHEDLHKKYHDPVRSEFLEARTENAARKAFPEAKIYRGLKWPDLNGELRETDLLVWLDSHALIFECKSGHIRARARRGDSAALKQELEKLIEDPSMQGRRFADYLLRTKSPVRLQDSRGLYHELNPRALLRVTPVNIVLKYLGPIGIQHQLLRDAGLVDPNTAPIATIALHDLECILDALDFPAAAFHYLRRRAEIESSNQIMTDEMGFLSTYLATSFDFGDFEGDPNRVFALPTMGDQLTPYFMGREIGTPIPKPKLRLRGWWSDMLRKFEERKFTGWLEASYTLLSVGYNQQLEFERAAKKVTKEVRSNWHSDHNNTCILIVGAPSCRSAILCIAVKKESREETRSLACEQMSLAREKYGADRILAICLSAAQRVYPYLAAYFTCKEIEQAEFGSPGHQPEKNV
jgi:hypothetical protein